MTPPDHDVILGTSADELSVHQLHTEVRVVMQQRADGGQVYLALEGIRGTQDATVLRVSLHPEGSEQPSEFVGSVGLYGLRRASGPSARGLRFTLDVTAWFHGSGHDAGAVVVSIELGRELAAASAIAIERLVVFQVAPPQ